MITGVARSCYIAPCRFYQGGPISKIRYYFAPEGAKFYTGPNVFWPHSGMPEVDNVDGVGEITSEERVYDKGFNYNKTSGQHYEGTPDDFAGNTPVPAYQLRGEPTPVALLPACDNLITIFVEMFFMFEVNDCELGVDVEISYKHCDDEVRADLDVEVDLFYESGEEVYRFHGSLDVELEVSYNVDVDDRWWNPVREDRVRFDNIIDGFWDDDGRFISNMLQLEVSINTNFINIPFRGMLEVDVRMFMAPLEVIHRPTLEVETEIFGRRVPDPFNFIEDLRRRWLLDPIVVPEPPWTGVVVEPAIFDDNWIMLLQGLSVEVQMTEKMICTPLPLKWLMEVECEMKHLPINGHCDLEVEVEMDYFDVFEWESIAMPVDVEMTYTYQLDQPPSGITCPCSSVPVNYALKLIVIKKPGPFAALADDVTIVWRDDVQKWRQIDNDLLHPDVVNIEFHCTNEMGENRWKLFIPWLMMTAYATGATDNPFVVQFDNAVGYWYDPATASSIIGHLSFKVRSLQEGD